MKLSKEQTKKHDECLKILAQKEIKSLNEREFVFEHFHPGSGNNIGRGGIFFTPPKMASDFGLYYGDTRGRVVDLCAGIGALGDAISGHGNRISELVCVEVNPEFVQWGKKLLPDARWICADVFQEEIIKNLGCFDVGISNPPFGRVITASEHDWFRHKGPAHMRIAELIFRRCQLAGWMIIPDVDHDMQGRYHPIQFAGDRQRQMEPNGVYQSFKMDFPDANITPGPFDPKNYQFKETNIRTMIVELSTCDGNNSYFKS